MSNKAACGKPFGSLGSGDYQIQSERCGILAEPWHIGNLLRLCILSAAIVVMGSGQASAQIIERDLHRGIMEGPAGLDPHYAARPVELAILTDLFMGLVTQDASGELRPGAAESWTVENEGRRWVFKLREDTKWSDGRLLVAQDFVFSFQRLLAPESGAPFASMFDVIAGTGAKEVQEVPIGVSARDRRTLVFDLKRPAPYFLSLLVHPAASPLRKDLIERNADSWTRPGRMVTNGPYILGEWLPGRHIKLRKNWGFYDPASVIIDNVFYDIVEHGEIAFERFFSGEIDILSGLRRDQIPELLEKTPEVVRLHPTLTVDYLVFNTDRPPFDDVRIRQALALAVDSRTLVNNVLDRGEIPATGMFPDIVPQSLKVNSTPDDPRARRRPRSPESKRAEAKRLLAVAGYGARGSLRLTLHYNDNERNRKVAEKIADMWESIGVETDLYGNHYAVHYGDLGIGDFEVARAGWIADFDDPVAVLGLFRSTNERFNYGGFSDDRVDRLLEGTNTLTDPRERKIILSRAHEQAMSQYPVVPLYHHASRHLVSPKVKGWKDNVRDIHPSRFLDKAD